MGLLFVGLNAQIVCASQGNLVTNGKFELDLDKDYKPDSWCLRGSWRVRQELKLDDGHTGSYSAQVRALEFADVGSNAHCMLTQEKGLPVLKKSKLYRLTFWAKQKEMKTGTASVAIRNSQKGGQCGLSVMFQVPEKQWKKYSYVFKPKQDCSVNSRLQFWFRETGVFWLDDVKLEEEVAESRKPGNILSVGDGKNLVPNSGFECGLDGWGSVTAEHLGSYGGLDELVGSIDMDKVFQDSKSMKIDLSIDAIPEYNFDHFFAVQKKIKDPLLANVGWIHVTKGKEYVLSAYLKAGRPGLIAEMGIKNFLLKPFNLKKKKLTTDWKRYFVKVKPESDYCFVVIGPDLNVSRRGKGTLWIDNIQFEQGSKVNDYEQAQPLEMGLHIEKPGNIFTHGESVQLLTSFWNVGAHSQHIKCDLELFDFYGNKIKSILLKKSVLPKVSLAEKINLGVLPTNFYSITATLSNSGAVVSRKKIRMAVVPPRSSAKSMFGINHGYGKFNILKLANAGGIDWCRTWSLKWQEIEPEKGKINFFTSDKEINRLIQADMNILGLIPLPSSEWSSSAPSAMEFNSSFRSQRVEMSYMPRRIDDFTGYVKIIVKHYKDHINYWQILNEPLGYSLPRKKGYRAQDYVFLSKAAWHAVKETDPQGKVLVGFRGLGSKQLLDNFKEIFAEGILDFCDVITVHCYPELATPEQYEKPLKELNSLMEKYGSRKPIWITEFGYYADDDFAKLPPTFNRPISPLKSEKEQAAYAVRFATMARANGVEKIFFHAGKTSRLNRDNLLGVFFEYGGEPRKIYPAIAVFSELLPSNSIFLKEIFLDDGIKSYLFKTKDDLVVVAWATDTDKAPQVALGNSNIQAYDFMADLIFSREIPLSSYPVYIIGKDISAEELEMRLRTVNTSF